MVIQHNMMAINAYRGYNTALSNYTRSMQRLSSGLRINSAADDPAGLAISEKMRGQIRGMSMASKNCADAYNMMATAEGAMQEMHGMLQRLNELAVQSASDTNENSIDRNALNEEFQELLKEIDDTVKQTRFNGHNLLGGGIDDFVVQSGANAGDTLSLTINKIDASGLGIAGLDISTRDGASGAIKSLGEAINQLSLERARAGATMNRLDHKINNLENSIENLSAAESRIRDVDYAKEIIEFTRAQLQMQAATAVLAQANAMPRNVLKLLGMS